MQRTRWQTLLLVTVVAAAVTWILLRAIAGRGGLPPSVPPLVVVVELLIAAVVFGLGWTVRQFLRGKRPLLDPIRAARTVVLAKASCYTGALLAGWYGGQVLVLVGELDVPGNGGRAVAAGVATGGAVVLAVVGLVVEWFCRVPPPEAGEQSAGEHSATDPSAG
ncbi:DUF3180 domain-containing protein [Cellulomonas fengjieae]|uniref:DUF3180 domain-containing protein n=1 Tax=Cellulomonas fengjieae TaxID=2819978 RepID=A0ABS3SH20_9CELL|nr:DUF3180 domain-containing protein [Cellulomonas fengjieae]MBO3085045.1 DUF3180 domain-containing protein [Cellulomonas fengjieae]MBO3100792.1 DUF3180 domain-containing protein [Cellulomonas fengjieae]QVI66364.1 DUF3180 domain-containing protein [Cellulomonas fengjieae]